MPPFPARRSLRILRLSALGLCLWLSGFAVAADRQLPGHVTRVVDGDSLVLTVSGSEYRVELEGIDAPELSQPWGRQAAQTLYRLLTGAFIVIEDAAITSSGIVTGSVRFKGRDVALDLLSDGLAWALPAADAATSASDPYAIAEAEARQARRGLWADPEPLPPWVWRARNRETSLEDSEK